ncbi:hypothetical protein RRG08_049451 [Elysia crispata]|uniref:Uncharacterized protein n=1 Tax=Elysia crispata TaxID=231223 RepID=A0AAE0ZS00_9GAST|nr:hypothetical protein RRG08_049451 [Elysia crispata]
MRTALGPEATPPLVGVHNVSFLTQAFRRQTKALIRLLHVPLSPTLSFHSTLFVSSSLHISLHKGLMELRLHPTFPTAPECIPQATFFEPVSSGRTAIRPAPSQKR